MFQLKGDQIRRSKKQNGKFQRGTKAYEERRKRLGHIVARMTAGKNFSDLQGDSALPEPKKEKRKPEQRAAA